MFAITSVVFLLGTAVNAKKYHTVFPNVTWDDSNWRIATTNLDQGHYQSRMSLANGYLGINVAAAGPFFEVDTPVNGDIINGWPLWDRRQTFATISGFYANQADTNGTNFPWLLQYGGESVIAGVPHWAGLLVESNGHVLNASVPSDQISDFSSTLDMKAGSLTWAYNWSPPGAAALGIEYSMLVHKLYVNMGAVRLRITSQEDSNVTVIDAFNGDCAVRSDFAEKGLEPDTSSMWSAVRPHWVGNVTAYLYSTLQSDGCLDMATRKDFTDAAYIGGNQSSIGQSVSAQLIAGKTSIITKFVGGASSDAFENPKDVARNASISGAVIGFDTLLWENYNEWHTIMPPDSVDNYAFPENETLTEDMNIISLQVEAVTNPWNIIQNTVGTNAIAAAGNNTNLDSNSIAVGGLGSSSYAGWIFWDAEIWMAPGLVVSNPQAAKQIANYRVKQFDQAKENIKEAYTSSKNDTKFTEGGAVYPWTSGRYGNCTAGGPCWDYEYHINGDIGLEMYNYLVASGDSDHFREYMLPVYDSIAYFYGELIAYNKSSDKYVLTNATDPDEYANHVDNAGFTMALMQTHLATANELRTRFGLPINETWADQGPKIEVSVNTDANIILEYSTMNGSISVKQADVVLIDDFLDYPNPYSLSDLDYYAGKQSMNGPGMTYGVYSIVASEVSPSGCSAYTYDLYGSDPYVRAPWFQYSEQLLDDYEANGGTHPAYPFLTGMGGSLRVAIFGYLGLRLFVDTLNVYPSLPPQIPYLDYRTFYWQGHAIDARSNQTHTTLTRLAKSLPNSNSSYASLPIPLTLGPNTNITPLPPNGTITIENRQISTNKTVPGNIAQCRPVSSDQDYLPGQFPLSAVDGAISTKWQPVQANQSSVLTVEILEPPQPITAIEFDWAQQPPLSYSVVFSNSSTFGSFINVTASDNITISNPYDPANDAIIVAYKSNSTTAKVDPPVWSGSYARLTIYGTHSEEFAMFNNGSGAMVAEWAIVGNEGSQPQPERRRLAVELV
ncbi:putative acid trehalase [Tothia fuscella]|uniref:alpha,alpha-trehalase n=1 Tax=Tothia fuscella TaxID=1048955 RepID=A0A9P4TZS1_9PEZI|nr:putative acid trehalase [Tothia fuscella]